MWHFWHFSFDIFYVFVLTRNHFELVSSNSTVSKFKIMHMLLQQHAGAVHSRANIEFEMHQW